MEVGNSSFKAFIDLFTSNTYIMAILSDPRIHTATLQVNIKAGRQGFEAFIP
jgi:Ras-related GTP-binding protein A/B